VKIAHVQKIYEKTFTAIIDLIIEKMRVFLFGGAVSAVDWVPGVNPVNCGADYFRPGAEWPLESAANAGRTVR